jgi:hypothetical protein
MGCTRKSAVSQKCHGVPETGAYERGGHPEHFSHARAAFGSLVTNNNNIVGLDLTFLHGFKCVFLTIENSGRA